ncbi:MAG: hypothetical protein WCI43_03635 [Candidatus Firestonebacteria bacterium]
MNIDVIRNGEIVFSGNLSSLKRFKDDVKEVLTGYECGIGIEGMPEMQAGDLMEVVTQEKILRKLGDNK